MENRHNDQTCMVRAIHYGDVDHERRRRSAGQRSGGLQLETLQPNALALVRHIALLGTGAIYFWARLFAF